jgi:hypothetical protein
MGSFQLPALLNSRPENNPASMLRNRQAQAPEGRQKPTNQKPPALGLGHDRGNEISSQYEAAVYRSQYERVAFSATLQEVAAALSEGAGGTQAQAAARQLEFNFFAESRTEELVLFRERTQRVAEGQQGQTRETLTQISQRVAAKFELSLSVSGTALNGFASAAEGAQSDNDLLDKVLGFSQQLLDKAFEKINDAFELMGDFFKGAGGMDDFATRLNDLFQGLLKDVFGEGNSPAQLAAPSQGGQQVAAVSSMQLEFKFSFSAEMSVQQGVVQESDPIILDLDNDGFEMTSYRDGARFDILGSGQTVNTAFVTGGDAFLALDRNGNGSIDSGAELFGDQRGAANGYEELRKLDSNGDNRIDRNDAAFESLRLFRDNGNGITEAGELISLAEAGIAEISLQYSNVNERTSGGNRLAQIASFRRTDGTLGRAADAILNYTV